MIRSFTRAGAAVSWVSVLVFSVLVTLSGRAEAGGARDSATTEARARFDEGVALFDAKRYDAARAKFAQAYALRPHADVLFNLASADLAAGHAANAEVEYERFLKESKNATPERRAEAERGLADARAAQGEHHGEAGTTELTSAEVGALPVDASAEHTPERSDALTRGYSVFAGLGYTSDDLDVGLALRGGGHVAERIYVGGTFVYQVGSSVSYSTAYGDAKSSLSAFYVGPEGGYDFAIRSFLVRPYAGLGLAGYTASASGPGVDVSHTTTKLVLWPGVTGLYPLGDGRIVLGADFRFVTVPGGPAISLFAMAGTQF